MPPCPSRSYTRYGPNSSILRGRTPAPPAEPSGSPPPSAPLRLSIALLTRPSVSRRPLDSAGQAAEIRIVRDQIGQELAELGPLGCVELRAGGGLDQAIDRLALRQPAGRD